MCERVCPWCGSEFETKHQAKVYCTLKCKTEFNNWMTVEGRKIMPIAMAWRINRGSKGVGSSAMKELCTLLDMANEKYRDRPIVAKKRPTISDHFKALRLAGNSIIRAIDRR